MKLHSIRKNATGNASFGCMWERGRIQNPAQEFVCINEDGNAVKLQSRVTAYWPDGSVKWTSHVADAEEMKNQVEVFLKEGISSLNYVEQKKKDFQVIFHKDSPYLFEEVLANGKCVMKHAKTVLMLEHPMNLEGEEVKILREYLGLTEKMEVEEDGDLQMVVKFEGIHVLGSERKIPFVIRMTVGKRQGEIRFQHTFLYDGDENKDFLKGIGIRFEVPVSGNVYNRHVKIMGDYGVFHEACLPLISWRPRIPEELYEQQMNGTCMQISEKDAETIKKVVSNAPAFSEYTLCQDSDSHFRIRKKMAEKDVCYLDSLHGKRTNGGFALGSEAGSVMIGIRDFWEKYPSGVTVKNLANRVLPDGTIEESDLAEATVWFYSPEAESYDFRHYANRGYNQVCYEGYDYKGADPVGIACTNDCAIAFEEEMIPSDERLETFSANINTPPLFVADPQVYHDLGAFGYWSLPNKSNPVECWIEEQLNKAFFFYQHEVEQRGWYGLFNYGDFMHTYDGKRHQWKYDIGGYAWDNTELVPTLWLWYYFMRTGNEEVFTLAEKLSRHASEVDVYHFGKYKGLGSRHNVRHWGCPCKEARIAMAAHHRVYYYVTGDRRLEDIFDELKDNELSFLNKDPLGDFFDKKDMVYPSHARSGPDWSSLCSNWMMEWERKLDSKYRDKMVVGLEDLKKAPLKLASGPDFEFDPKTLHLRYIGERTTGGTHLQVCMGAPSVWMEMADLLSDEEFKDMLAQLGRFALLPREQQLAESKGLLGEREYTFPFMFSGLAAYAAHYQKDALGAKRTWRVLLETMISESDQSGFTTVRIENQGNQRELVEIPWITTNFVSQWCLNMIIALEFIRESMPKDFDEVRVLLETSQESAFHKA